MLQAQVALSNQYPQLISARNNYRIAQLQLAKTLGLDFDPNRGDSAPLEALGELTYVPRSTALTEGNRCREGKSAVSETTKGERPLKPRAGRGRALGIFSADQCHRGGRSAQQPFHG